MILKVLGIPACQPKTTQATESLIASIMKIYCINGNSFKHRTPYCCLYFCAASYRKSLLWTACRHHVCEIFLTQVFNNLEIESPKSPNSALFGSFKNIHNLNQKHLKTIDFLQMTEECKQLAGEFGIKSLG